jgi:hypothetical protein
LGILYEVLFLILANMHSSTETMVRETNTIRQMIFFS